MLKSERKVREKLGFSSFFQFFSLHRLHCVGTHIGMGGWEKGNYL